MLSNAYFLAKIRFDTAENEPAKNLQIFLEFLPLLHCYCCLQRLPQSWPWRYYTTHAVVLVGWGEEVSDEGQTLKSLSEFTCNRFTRNSIYA